MKSKSERGKRQIYKVCSGESYHPLEKSSSLHSELVRKVGGLVRTDFFGISETESVCLFFGLGPLLNSLSSGRFHLEPKRCRD